MLAPEPLARLEVELGLGRPILFVRLDTLAERREFLAWLAARGAMRLVWFQPGDDPVGRIVEAGKEPGVIVALGDEALAGESRVRWIRALNIGRDRLRELGGPLLSLLDNRSLNELATNAPDLWSWRSSVSEPGIAVVAAPPAEAAPAAVAGGVPATTVETAYAALSAKEGYEVDPGDQGWGPVVRGLAHRLRMGKPSGPVLLGAVPGVGVEQALRVLEEAVRPRPLVVTRSLGATHPPDIQTIVVVPPSVLMDLPDNADPVASELLYPFDTSKAEGVRACAAVIEARVSRDVFESPEVEVGRLADCSGGVADLLLLAREAALAAAVKGAARIGLDDLG